MKIILKYLALLNGNNTVRNIENSIFSKMPCDIFASHPSSLLPLAFFRFWSSLSWITQQPPNHSLHPPPLLYLSHLSLLLPEWGSKVQLWCHPSRLACWGSRGGQWEMSSPSRTEQVPWAWLPTPSLLHLSLWWGPSEIPETIPFPKRVLHIMCHSSNWHCFCNLTSV